MYLDGEAAYHDRDKFPFPDVLILDVKMPNGNGFEVLGRLRERQHIRIPVLMFSASDAPRDIAASMRLGARDYFVKPLSVQGMMDLAKSINERWLRGTVPPQVEVEKPKSRESL